MTQMQLPAMPFSHPHYSQVSHLALQEALGIAPCCLAHTSHYRIENELTDKLSETSLANVPE